MLVQSGKVCSSDSMKKLMEAVVVGAVLDGVVIREGEDCVVFVVAKVEKSDVGKIKEVKDGVVDELKGEEGYVVVVKEERDGVVAKEERDDVVVKEEMNGVVVGVQVEAGVAVVVAKEERDIVVYVVEMKEDDGEAVVEIKCEVGYTVVEIMVEEGAVEIVVALDKMALVQC